MSGVLQPVSDTATVINAATIIIDFIPDDSKII